MYVCVCNAITDKQIRAAAEGGTTDLWALQAELGVATGCGSCTETASQILAEYRRPAPAKVRGSRFAGDPVAQPQIYVPALA
jgi:bacterioferritin-associated ferredoxin